MTTVDDDERSLTSLPEGVTEDDIPGLARYELSSDTEDRKLKMLCLR